MSARLVAAVALLLALGAPFAAAQDDDAPARLETLMGAFARLPGLEARFHEEKQLALLAVPLESEGRIFFAPPDRFLRRVEAPTRSEARIVGDELRLESADRREVIDLARGGPIGVFVGTFRRLLSGDTAGLSRDYEVRVSGTRGAWEVALEPKSEVLGRFVRRLTFAGDGQVLRRMTLVEPNGDATRTRFTEIDAARRFSAAELAELFP